MWPPSIKEVVKQLDEDNPVLKYPLMRKQDPRYSSELHFATLSSNSQLTKKIIMAGGDVNSINSYGETPLHWASKSGNIGAVKLLIGMRAKIFQDGDGNTPLHWAAEYDNVEVADILIKSGNYAEVENGDSKTPMEIACESGSVNMVKFFLQRGIEIFNGLQLAIENDCVEVVKVLLENLEYDISCLEDSPVMIANDSSDTHDFLIKMLCVS